MAKAKIEEQGLPSTEEQPPRPSQSSIPTNREEGVPLVTVVYSVYRDVYKVPSANADLWLSVKVDIEPHPGAMQTADGKGWRRAYCSRNVIYAGPSAALPADDPLVVDYLRQAKAEEL